MRLLRWLGLIPAEASRLDEEHWLGEEVEELWRRGGWVWEQLQELLVGWPDGVGGMKIPAPFG